MKNIQFFFGLFCLLHLNCTLHHLKIDGSPAVRYVSPVKEDRTKFDLDRITAKKKISDNFDRLVESYNSDALTNLLEKGGYIQIDKNANYTLRYSIDITEDMPFPISPIFFLLTLGIFPVVETTDGFVTIQLIDNSSEKIIKEYRYEVAHKYVTSWLSIVASLILWGDQWDLAMFHNHGFPQEMIVSKFQKDFYTDLSNQKILFVSNSKNEKRYPKERYAILPVIYSHSKDKKTSDVIRDKIETVLVNKKYTVLERTKMNEITKEFKLAQTGLTRNDQIELGKMLNATNLILTEILELNQDDKHLEFSIKNLDVESGQILWKYEFTIDETNLSESINKAMEGLKSSIENP